MNYELDIKFTLINKSIKFIFNIIIIYVIYIYIKSMEFNEHTELLAFIALLSILLFISDSLFPTIYLNNK
jgi:hypothetical protein